jgi:hypothetical protein
LTDAKTGTGWAAGGGLLHPVPLLAIAVLVLNDHWGKQTFSSVLTGKLSDVAGLAFFPLLLQALIEVACALGRRRWRPSRRVLVGCAVVTAAVFALINLWAPASEAYRYGLYAIQWPFRAAWALASGAGLPAWGGRVALTPDPTDLWTLPAVGLAVWAGWRRSAPAALEGRDPAR